MVLSMGKCLMCRKKLFVWENPQGAGRLFVWRVYVSRQGSCESGCPAKILCLQDFPISHTPPPQTSPPASPPTPPQTPPSTSPTPPPSYLSRSTPSEIIESHTHVDIASSFNILFPKGQTRVTMMIESLQDILFKVNVTSTTTGNSWMTKTVKYNISDTVIQRMANFNFNKSWKSHFAPFCTFRRQPLWRWNIK